jgi:transcriptional regulator with XRE-family HTH domain
LVESEVFMDTNAFGKLVRTYREQREWTQDELAERWGFTREYVSQIERGKRKLDKPEQVARLADVLGISEEQLTNVGKKLPFKQLSTRRSAEHDELLLEALLEPAQTTVKLSWLIAQGNGMLVDLTSNLHNLERRLSGALEQYRGQFHQPALRILASVHELLGKQAVERTATQDAMTHFQEMYDIAEELRDRDLLTLATIHQAAMFRRRGRFEASFRRFEVAERYARDASRWLQGFLWKMYARNFYVYGNEQGFLRAIDRAASIAENIEANVDTLTNGFDKISVLEERGQGHTMLWKPEKALAIYQETDKMRPFRPLREQSSSLIVKAQAYCYSGNLQAGIEHALAGLRIAEKLQSVRYVVRLQQMYDRLKVTPIGKERAMLDLFSEIIATKSKLFQV